MSLRHRFNGVQSCQQRVDERGGSNEGWHPVTDTHQHDHPDGVASPRPSVPGHVGATRFPATRPRHASIIVEQSKPTVSRSSGTSDPTTSCESTTSTTSTSGRSSRAPLHDRSGSVDGPARGDAAAPRGDHGGPVPCPMLFTPAQAAHRLQVRESWLRRRAAQRRIPCTFLGKHLRFSPANLNQIITDAADPTTSGHRPAPLGCGPAQASTRRSSAPIPTRRQQRPTG
jgi:hypothetical protein